MIQLITPFDYLIVFALAAVSGLVGGLAAELVLNRDGATGTFALPQRRDRLWDLGGTGRLVVGAAVGLAILTVIEPQTTVTQSGDSNAITRAYDVVRLVGTAIVAGSAGGSVLTALQASTLATINEGRVQATVAASAQQLEHLATIAKTEIAALGPEPLSARPRAIGGSALGTPEAEARESAAVRAAGSLDDAVEQAKAAVADASQPPGRARS